MDACSHVVTNAVRQCLR